LIGKLSRNKGRKKEKVSRLKLIDGLGLGCRKDDRIMRRGCRNCRVQHHQMHSYISKWYSF